MRQDIVIIIMRGCRANHYCAFEDFMLTMSVCSRLPSFHRRLLVKIAQGLHKDDIEQLVYLADIPFSEMISSGVGLMRSLEQHGKVAPGRYFYLLSCLRDIGRDDLVSLVTQSEPDGYFPFHFQMPSQLLNLKIQTLQRKQEKYLQSKKDLETACNQDYWQSLCAKQCTFLTDLTDGGQPIFDQSDMATVARTLILVVPQRIDVIANVLTAFQKHKSLDRAAQEIHKGFQVGINAINTVHSTRAGKHLFQQLVAGIETGESDSYKTFQTVPLVAQQSLADLLLDLVGEEHVKKWSNDTRQAIASISNSLMLCYPICWQLLSILMAFQVHVSFSPAEMFIDEELSSFIASQLPHYMEAIKANSMWITNVLQGTSLLEKIKEDGLIDDTIQSANAPLLYSVCPVAYASLIMIILHYSHHITASDRQRLKTFSKELLLNRASEFSQTYSAIEALYSKEVFQLLDEFRDDVLKKVLTTTSDTKELIVHVFQH